MKDQDTAELRLSTAAAPTGAEQPDALRAHMAAEVAALTRLNEASSRLWRLSDLKEGLDEILAAAIALLGGHKGYVQLLGPDGLLRIVAQHGFDASFVEKLREVSPDHETACGRALRMGRRVIVEDVEADEANAPLREIAREADYRAVQSTPILSRDGRLLGMISTHCRAPHRPKERNLRLLDLYVEQAAAFIERCYGDHQLRTSEQRFKSLSDIVPGTILWAAEPDGACAFLSRGWQEFTGQPAERAMKFGWLQPIHPDDRERTRRIFLEATNRREAFVVDCRVRRTDGEFRWLLVSGRPRYENSRYLGLVGSVIDAHERKLAENALRESEALLAGQKEAFEAAMDGAPLATSLDALIRTVVAHYGDARAAFYMLDEDAGGGLHHVTGMNDDYASVIDGFEVSPESLACGLAVHRREPVITPDVERDALWDKLRWLARAHDFRSCWSFPVLASDGPVLGTLAVYFREPRTPTVEDFTVVASMAQGGGIVISRYREAAERARAEHALLETNRRKDEFLAVLGHELRNPLAPLSVATDLLEHAASKPKLIEIVRPMMRRQLDHLTRLVDDLLDISRISRGHAELHRAPLDLRDAVDNAIEQNRPLMVERHHTLRVELGERQLAVDGDLQRLTQVFGNLLSNAVKYSDAGGEITVRTEHEGGAALVRVTDRGFGIPQQRVGDLFRMFSQVPEHRALVGGGGLGIGLALCRQLVELHGGSIHARSEGLGRGSEFLVRLPLVAGFGAELAARNELRRRDSPRRRVLVVDDNADAAESLRMVLELQGHEAHAVFNGAAALEELTAFHAEIVLLDLGMPQMDGFEVARRIRALPGGRNLLLVALTGWGQAEDRRRTADAGFDEHLTKPVDSMRLAAMLAAGV